MLLIGEKRRNKNLERIEERRLKGLCGMKEKRSEEG